MAVIFTYHSPVLKVAVLALSALCACGTDSAKLDASSTADGHPDDDSKTADAGPTLALRPVAPTIAHSMYQGAQDLFTTQLGTTCHGRVAASMGETGFCYLASDDNVKCAGTIGGVNYGMSFSPVGQTGASQIMVFFGGLSSPSNGMCITKTDHTVQCMGTNTNAFGVGMTSQFSQWTARTDLAAIGSATWDQICGITTAGQVLCGGLGFAIPPINQGAAGQISFWVDVASGVHLSDTTVLRPGESRTECRVQSTGMVLSTGLVCNEQNFGPSDGSVVSGSTTSGDAGIPIECWLTTDGSVTCTTGPRFAVGKVLYLATNYSTDSLCAIYNDGSVWCLGSNISGKLGTGNTLTLDAETMVAPAGSARIACD
jgi:hypothetical protein